MDPLTAIILTKSLDGLTMRAEATAHNIANANSPGYRPVRVSFEDAMAEAALKGPEAVLAMTFSVEQDPAFLPDDAVRLDMEMVTASSTAGRYAALVELLNRHSQITALAVSGGR